MRVRNFTLNGLWDFDLKVAMCISKSATRSGRADHSNKLLQLAPDVNRMAHCNLVPGFDPALVYVRRMPCPLVCPGDILLFLQVLALVFAPVLAGAPACAARRRANWRRVVRWPDAPAAVR